MWLIQLSASAIEVISTRLAFPSVLTKTAIAASKLRAEISSIVVGKPSTRTFYLDQFPILSVYAVWVYFIWEEYFQQSLSKYLLEWRHIKPFTTGYTLQQRGLEPGPRFKEILTRLRAAWLDGEVRTEEEEQTLLSRLSKA
jgi:tRNA nucleotidyltransferase (CCA-adding enzyme)